MAQSNIELFVKEYQKLVEKYKVDFANYPVFVPDGKDGFKVIIQTTPVDMEEYEKGKKKAELDKAFITQGK